MDSDKTETLLFCINSTGSFPLTNANNNGPGHPVSILHKSIAGRYRPVRVADGPKTTRYKFMQNASWACRTICYPSLFYIEIFCNVKVNSKDTDQSAQMIRLIWAFVLRICHEANALAKLVDTLFDLGFSYSHIW